MQQEGRNVYAGLELGGSKSCVILFGSHYDTKPMPERQLGANDSGSSSVALLQIAAYFLQQKTVLPSSCDLGFVWFDGEEAQLPGWDDGLRHPSRLQDNTYGSRNFVANLTSCGPNHCLPATLDERKRAVRALVLLDMIGAEPMILSQDTHTSAEWKQLLGPVLQSLGMTERLSPVPRPISDDHLPFLQKGIPAINLINFEVTTHWHRSSDTVDQIHMPSIEDFSRLAISLTLSLPPI
jgi:glutaminyl-peptide cyclotransferase